MVKKSEKTVRQNRAVKFAASLLVVVLLLVGMILPASAESIELENSASAAEPLLSFWSNLIDWFSGAASAVVPAYYSADTGFTLLGVLVCVLFAVSVVVAFVCWLLDLFRFSH